MAGNLNHNTKPKTLIKQKQTTSPFGDYCTNTNFVVGASIYLVGTLNKTESLLTVLDTERSVKVKPTVELGILIVTK